MKKMLVGLRIVFRRVIRKVTRLCGRNVAWDLKHPVADSVINALLTMVTLFFLFYPMSCESPVVLSVVIASGLLIGCMGYSFLKWVGKSERRVQNAKYWYLWGYAISLMLLLAVSGMVGCSAIGGDDDIPTIYSDLQVKDYDCECAEHENAFVVLTNLAQRINSEKNRIGESFVWQNQASNDLWMAMFDKVANCKNYNPMSLSDEAMCYRKESMYGLAPLLEFNRSNLCVRITSAARHGHFDEATKWFAQDTRVGQLIRTNCGTFMEYEIGRAFIQDSVENIRTAISEFEFPDDCLKKIDRTLQSLCAGEKEDLINALKREYTVTSMAYADDYWFKFADDYWCNKWCKSWVKDWRMSKMFYHMQFRYVYHPNRMLRAEGTNIREFIHKVESGVELDGGEHKIRWFSRFFPNGAGRELAEKKCDWYREATHRIQFTTPLYYQIASRVHVAATRYKLKYGKNPKTCADLVEFMEKVPQKLLGKDVEVDLEKGVVHCGDIIEEVYHDEENAYAVLSKLVGTEACPSNCYCDVYRKENLRIDIHSPENQFLTQYWDVDTDDAQSDDCTIGGYHFGYQYPHEWRKKNMFTNRVEYARIVDDIIASNDVVAAMIQKASKCSIYDSGTNGVDTSALISVMRGYGCVRIYRMIETGRTSEAVAALRQLVRIGELAIKGRASIDEKCMGMAIIRNAQEVARLSIPFLSKNELLEMALLFKLDGPMYGVDMHEDIVHGYWRNDMLRIEIAEALRRRFGVEWSDEIKYLHRRIMQAYDEDICIAFQTRCYREGIGVVANVKWADEMEAGAVNYTYRKMESYLNANPFVPAKDDDKKKGRKWSLKHSIWRDMYDADTTDAWGRQFKYHWSSKTGYLTIMSSGCDGKWGTDDDLEKTAYADTSSHTKGEDR